MPRKVGMVTVAYNHPELIRWQLPLLDHFCTDGDYEVVVVDNSYERSSEIQHLAGARRYLKTDCDMRGTSQSHIHALVSSYEQLRDDYDLLAYLDHDLFPVAPFSVESILDGYELAGVPLSGDPNRPAYDPALRALWAGFLLIRNRPEYHDLIDLNGNYAYGFDSGGNIYKLVEHVGHDRVRWIDQRLVDNPRHQGYPNYNYYAELCGGGFVHFIDGSGWNVNDQLGQEARIPSLLELLAERTGMRF